MEALDKALPATYFMRAPFPWEAAFLTAKVFASYKRRGGSKSSPYARRYRVYFPKLKIIAP